MRIQHNIMAMNAYRNYNNNTSALSKNLEKLSSGYKINRAGDDAAGLAISEKMRAQITGLNAASKNVKDGISLVKTGEGAMQEIQDMLNRMDYLATQSANGTYDNEVDRANLQKEVKALKDEINRIADSANFNGIKLLDGKTGLNNNAFTLSSEAAVNAVNPGAITISFAASNAGNNDFHGTLPAVGAQTAEFTIDLGDLSVDASGGDAVITVTFGNQSITIACASDGGTNGDGKWSASDIVNAITAAVAGGNSMSVGGTTIGTVAMGGYNFKVEAVNGSNATGTGNAIKFTMVGANGKELNADDMTSAQADVINTLDGIKGGAVSIGSSVNTTKITGTYNHKVDDVQQAVAKDSGQKAGITFDLTADMLTEDVELVIDGTTFTFLTDTTNAATATSTQIDLRDVIKAGGNTTAQLTEAIDQLSQKSTTNFDITKDSNGKLHIEQKAGSTEEYDYERLTSDEVVKATNNGAAKPAKNAGTGITIDSNSVAYGDKITIGGKTFVFQNDASKVGADEKQVNGKTATDLMNAINNDSTLGLTAELDPNNSNKVIVRSSAAGNTAAAPLVGGTGLTLQIGDTSDDFNQMNLQIKNMHVNAMGTMDASGNVTKSIADIDISTQAGAQEAVDVIKNAINYVSSVRGDLGAIQNRLEHTGNNLSVMAENIQDAESTIRDTDVAEEMMSYVKNNILVQSAQAMLAQANQVPQGVLQLLG